MATHVERKRQQVADESDEELDDEAMGSDEEVEISDDDADSDDSLRDDYSGGELSSPEPAPEGSAGSDDETNEAQDENALKTTAEDQANPIYRNFGWADAMSKVLKSSKPKNKKSVILARAKKDVDTLKAAAEREKETPLTFEIDGKASTTPEAVAAAPAVKTETPAERLARRQKRKEWDLIGRKKPDLVQDRDREKTLSKIATRGVVQLFNSVKMQQKTIQDTLKAAGPLERKREKALQSFDKSEFLNLLNGSSGQVHIKVKKEAVKKEQVKKEKVKEEQASWSVLRDDFMPTVSMRDWDKQQSSDSGDESN